MRPLEDGQSLDEVQEMLETQKEIRNVYIENAKTDRALKKLYGIILIIMLFGQLAMVNIIFVFGGLGKLSYSDTTFNVFISGALIEVIIVIKIAVQYLFTDNISKTLNNVMEISHHDNRKKQK